MAEDSSSPPPAVSIEDFAFQSPHSSSPHSMPQDAVSTPPASALSPPHDYNFSPVVYDESSAPPTDHEDLHATTDDEKLLRPGAETTSSRSSISSLPASIIASAVASHSERLVTPTRTSLGFGDAHAESNLRSYGRKSTPQERENDLTPFRHPSSVRAMQMRDELDDDLDPTPNRRRHGSHMSAGRISTFSTRSSNSTSPTKRGSRSNQSSPQKSSSKLKKEFPLVLLHCSLLPPTLGLQMKVPESWWMREVLPEEYWKRWKTLEEKVMGNGEVKTRGILIPHPRADYELLEERLLECLELERPRLRGGHFLGNQSGKVHAHEEDESETECMQTTKCPDCGKKVSMEVETERKWEIKIYAANGLMRAGAWGAAWGEMEKVDVEVGIWMPQHVRRDIEARLHDMGYTDVEEEEILSEETAETEEERRRREIYGNTSPHSQEKVDGLFDNDRHTSPVCEEDLQQQQQQQQQQPSPAAQHPPQVDLQVLVLNYFKVLTQDKRNVVIVILGLLVVFYAAASLGAMAPRLPATSPMSTVEVVTTTITATPLARSMSECTTVTSSTSSKIPTAEPLSTSLSQVQAVMSSVSPEESPVGSLSTSLSEYQSVTSSASLAETSSDVPPAEPSIQTESQPVFELIAAAFLTDEIPDAMVEQ